MAGDRSWIGVVDTGATIAATIAVRPWVDDDLDGATVAEVCSFYVHPHWWGRRIGRPLLERALDEAGELGFDHVALWVLEANTRARRIYAEHGWVADGAAREVAPGVRDLRYRLVTSVATIEIDDVYDPETVARIDAARPADVVRRPVGKVRQRSVAGAMAAAMMMGLREVFDPPQRSEIEQVDPWEGGGTNPWVRVHLDPDPRESIAEVQDH